MKYQLSNLKYHLPNFSLFLTQIKFTMKKYASLVLLAFLLNGCDDGDLTVDTIDFDNVTAASCDPTTNTLIYKLKTQESLLLQLPQANGIVNDPNVYIYDIDNNQYRVVYRAYDGKVETTNICGAIPPRTPNVTEEWLGKTGKIVITTTQIATDPDVNGATRINGYNHNIVFQNITFAKPAGDQVEAEFPFGDYKTTVTPANLTFQNAASGEAFICPDNLTVYNYNTSFTLTIENFDQSLLDNVVTPPGKPRTGAIGATTNKLFYRTFLSGTGSISAGYFCQKTTPSLPAVNETWVGENTNADLKAEIQVTTEQSGPNFIHTIVLANVSLVKGNSKFRLGTSFLLGKITK